MVFLVKPRLTEAAWASQKLWAVPLFFALIPLAATAAVAGAWERRLVAALARPSARRWGPRLLGLPDEFVLLLRRDAHASSVS